MRRCLTILGVEIIKIPQTPELIARVCLWELYDPDVQQLCCGIVEICVALRVSHKVDGIHSAELLDARMSGRN